MRQVFVYHGEDDFWVAECPSLPGCISQGKTKEDALACIREAIDLYIETLVEDGLIVPDHRRLDRGTLRAIIRQADMSVQEFLSLL